MSVSQIVRTANGLAPDIIEMNKTLAASGVPDPSLGVIGNTYVDTATGIEYQKNSLGWQAVYDISSVGPGVSDPLSLNQLNVDLIRGNAGDNVNINAGTTGTVQVILNTGHNLQVGGVGTEDNLVIEQNGNLVSGSLVKGFELLSDNFTGKAISINASAGKIEHGGAQPFIIENLTPGQTINIKSAGSVILEPSPGPGSTVSCLKNIDLNNNDLIGVRNITGDGTQNMIVGSGGFFDLVLTSNQKGVNVLAVNDNINLQANGTHAIIVKNAAAQEFIKMDGNNAAEFKLTVSNPVSSNSIDIKGVGDIIKTGTAPLTLEHLDPLGNINLRTSGGGGVIVMNDGAGNITFDALNERATIDKLDTTSINNSSSSTVNQVLSVTNAGVLQFSRPPETAIFTGLNIGSNGTHYLNASSLVPTPGDVSTYPHILGGVNAKIEANLIYSAPFTWGGGTSSLEIGYLAVGVPCNAANWTPIFTTPLSTAGDFYYTYTSPNIAIPGGKLAVRLVNTGTSSTSNLAEIIVKLILV